MHFHQLICAFILWRSALELLIGKFRQFLTVICPRHDNGGVLSFHVLFLFFAEFELLMFHNNILKFSEKK